MKNNKNILSILILSAIIIGLTSAKIFNYDTSFLSKIEEALIKHKHWMSIEKFYLHFDKPFYKPGDNIWFKGYLLNGNSLEPSGMSEIAYVELINPKGTVESKLTLPVGHGVTQGDFHLDEALPGGIYKVRAYTNWMKNENDSNYFEKDIQIQKVVFPRLLLKLEFEKEAYGAGDRVSAELRLRTLEDKPLKDYPFETVISLAGQKITAIKGETDKKGKVIIDFHLPNNLKSNDGLANILVNFEGNMESISRSIPIVLNNIQLQFFPEGGDLINSLETKVAFKATNEFGKPADVEGKIFNQENELVADFSSFHDGMGTFALNPEKSDYYALITNPKGISRKYSLPKVIENGYLLNIDTDTKNKLKIRVAATKYEEVSIVGRIREKIVYTQQLEVGKNPKTLEIDNSRLPPGVMQITLFDKYELARCERLTFVPQKEKLNIKITPNKKKYLPREKVELTIETTDNDNMPISANLSLAVVNDKVVSFADDKQDNLISWFLMSSELKGEIHEPSFYFNHEEEKADKALKLLMLTHGWRRFKWEEILNEEYLLSHFPEKASFVSGQIIDTKTNQPIKAEVTLLELNGKNRAAMVTTKEDGKFLFQNVNPNSNLRILARSDQVAVKSLKINLDNSMSEVSLNSYNSRVNYELLPPIIKEKLVEKGVVKENNQEFQQVDVVLDEDITSLEEVVVVGYGIQKKNDLTGSVVSVEKEDVLFQQGIENALQGRVAGVHVIDHAPGLGESANVIIRGVSSIASNEPLYVVDGIPMENFPDSKLSPVGHISPDEIESIHILKDAAAMAAYGSRASDGVIIISTQNDPKRFNYVSKDPKANYKVIPVALRKFSRVREFYSPIYPNNKQPEERNDFRTTVYWNPEIATSDNGKAKVIFYNNDEVSTFRITTEGFGPKGLLGRNETTFYSQMPFSIDAKIPPYLSFGDTVILQTVFKNNCNKDITGEINLRVSKQLLLLDLIPKELTIKKESTITIPIKFVVQNVLGTGNIKVAFKNKEINDAIIQEIVVQPKGFPVESSISGNELDKAYTLNISDPLQGSIQGKFTAYPDVTSNLLSGIESILREPYGCFEQTSSSTYPNIMVLQYLQESETANPMVYKKALDLIKKGYKRLLSFETKENGFEWFGRSPAHESLTAYGLLEFNDMITVYDGVNKSMIDRTIKYLMSRRDGEGNFKQHPKSLDKFGRASQEVTNAYILYSLSDAGINELSIEYEEAYREAISSKDPYRLSLVALSSFNLNKKDNAEKLLNILRKQLKTIDFNSSQIDHSITRSYGKSLNIETASLYLLASLKSEKENLDELMKVSEYLLNSRSYGGFGSTQATILALKSLTEYVKFTKQTKTSGTVKLSINNLLVYEKHYKAEHTGEIIFNKLEDYLVPGENIIKVKYFDTKEAVPYTLDFSWTSLTPSSSDDCKVSLATELIDQNVKVGETTRLNVEIQNKTSEGLPMTMAIIGLPSGLSAQPWQLKELQDKGVFDYYEIRKNYLVAYYRQMKPNELRTIKLDLKAEVPGDYIGPASTGYLYYTNEFKDWEKGLHIQVSN